MAGIGELEADILEADVAGDVRELAQAIRLGGVGGRVLEVVEVLEFGAGFGDLVGEGRHLVEAGD